ncbi:hypothetical protein KC318_g12053 [Hortaea werneckii]|nr:hypothetical protein KC334_g12295 [Hortaea werneckii]KAI6965416.1 hypothetical protein KC355_g12250 [Hortaea werneckii]KAI7657004.1 hypothetical protein KC318_g12053 [Hortaea werneckii]
MSTYRDGRDVGGEQSAWIGGSSKKPAKSSRWKLWKPKGASDNDQSDSKELPPNSLENDIQNWHIINGMRLKARRMGFGWNELTTEKENMLSKFFTYFPGPVCDVMELAVLLSADLRDWINFSVIIGALMLKAAVGWYQEDKQPMSLLRDIAMHCTVVRSGQKEAVFAMKVVPGDIMSSRWNAAAERALDDHDGRWRRRRTVSAVDCSIAVESASEAAQAAADIVFLASLNTIVLAIKTAREIFQRMKAYIQYRIALCLHLEMFLVPSMIIINETIRVDLLVFLAFFADLATVAIAYDNQRFRPEEEERS